MKAVWYEELGPARDVLEYGEMNAADPGPGGIRARSPLALHFSPRRFSPDPSSERGGGRVAPGGTRSAYPPSCL